MHMIMLIHIICDNIINIQFIMFLSLFSPGNFGSRKPQMPYIGFSLRHTTPSDLRLPTLSKRRSKPEVPFVLRNPTAREGGWSLKSP